MIRRLFKQKEIDLGRLGEAACAKKETAVNYLLKGQESEPWF
jgi:hypothetical protein